jgi:hypothetical protein
MISEQARLRAEKLFAKENHSGVDHPSCARYETNAQAIREKIARLRALRLARDAETANAGSPSDRITGTLACDRTR